MFLKNVEFFLKKFLFQIKILLFLNFFNMLMLKINLKKYYFKIFLNKKHFKKEPQFFNQILNTSFTLEKYVHKILFSYDYFIKNKL